MTYGILKGLPTLHGPIATLFTRMRSADNQLPPEGWAHSTSILLYKKGSTSEPANFRRIGLSNVLSKLYNSFLGRDALSHGVANGVIDPTRQKAFIPGVNGCVEHSFVVQEMVKNARDSGRALHLTSLDLRDAYGSVSHDVMFGYWSEREYRRAISITCGASMAL